MGVRGGGTQRDFVWSLRALCTSVCSVFLPCSPLRIYEVCAVGALSSSVRMLMLAGRALLGW
jgi:hypothetical protein